MENENPRQELFERFKLSLKRPVSERFFDEDELLEVYDYAGDLHDDYIQLEVLLCGARLYPESVALAERRAFLYLETTDDETDQPTDAGVRFLDDNPELTTPLFDIARVQAKGMDNAEQGLRFMLDQYTELSDEEAIRFIDLAVSLDCYEWIISVVDELKAKCDNSVLIDFELANQADNAGDNKHLIQFADSLIEAEPFVVHYWLMLLRGQTRSDMETEARSTFDYAKALANDDPSAILGLAEIAFNHAPYLLPEILDPVRELAERYPDDYNYTDCMCAITFQLGARDKAVAELKKYLDRHPFTPSAIRQLLACNDSSLPHYLKAYYDSMPSSMGFTAYDEQLVNDLFMRNNMEAVNYLLSEVLARKLLPDGLLHIWMEALYSLQKYQKIIALASSRSYDYNQSLAIPVKGQVVAYLLAAALIKTGEFDRARSELDSAIQIFETNMRDMPLAVRMATGQVKRLRETMDKHPADDTMFWSYYDPFGYGKF